LLRVRKRRPFQALAVAALAALVTCAWARAGEIPTAAPSAEPSPPDVINPVGPQPWYAFQDEYTPSYNGTNGNGNVVNFNAQLPLGGDADPSHPLRTLNLLRIKLSATTQSPGYSLTGQGDSTLWLLSSYTARVASWQTGVIAKIPTGERNSLGNGKWSLGPVVGYTFSNGERSVGLKMQSYFSVAGPSSRTGVAQTELTPSIVDGIGGGWAVGTSSMNFTYDWIINRWTNVPLGFSLERDFKRGFGRLGVVLEAEYNLAKARGSGGETLRLGVKWWPKT
jgi:hypothetical protein